MLSKGIIRDIEKAIRLQDEILIMYGELSEKREPTEKEQGMLEAIKHLKRYIVD